MNESEKMLNIIHENRKKEYVKNNALKARKNQKEQSKSILKLSIIITILIFLTIVFTLAIENDVKSCMSQGFTEVFCRYAGE